jgi:hypothetical protein
MVLKCSPDYSQEVMENIFRDITDAEIYIDDIGAFSHSWKTLDWGGKGGKGGGNEGVPKMVLARLNIFL